MEICPGIEKSYYETLLEEIQIISDFAIRRADSFYRDAQKEKETLIFQISLLISLLVVLICGVSIYLIREIRTPIKDLTSLTDQFRKGDLHVRSTYRSGSEIGSLASSFNNMGETIESEIHGKELASQMKVEMIKEEEFAPFCQNLLSSLIQHTGGQMGAIYLLSDDGTLYEVVESIGLSSSMKTSFSASLMEGELGKVCALQQIQHITLIPDDTSFIFSSVTGDIRPREILSIPILSDTRVVAVISIASVTPFSPAAIHLVHDIWITLIARFNGILSYRKIQIFSEKLDLSNRELVEKSRELVQQSDELREQNIELEIQKKQLDEANQLKSIFLSNMSHELRTPLNSVIALSGVLSRRLQKSIPEEEFGYIEVIERNGRYLLALINDILDLSRIESGKEEIILNRFTLKELMDLVLPTVEPQATEHQVTLTSIMHDDLPVIISDLFKCEHIMQNLLSNAVKFTEGGRVEVSAEQDGDTIRISVKDTGIGIPSDKIHYIFDEFRQADERIARRYGGTGLGLSIARKYARLLGGDIAVTSIQDVGSTFTLTLPVTMPGDISDVHQDIAHPPVAHKKQVSSPILEKSKNILLIEDSEPAIIQIRDLLSTHGYRLRVARNGAEALASIRESVPDAVILDLMMPEMDGFQVLAMIRSDELTSQLPVLILTAKHVTKEELMFLKGNHIYQLIQKGDINGAGLLESIRNMVSDKEKVPPREKNPANEKHSISRILIIEDNPDNLMTIRALLSDQYSLIEATDGQSGVDLAREFVPDLILLDISLPVLDGFEVLRQIRSDTTLNPIPVIALTALAMKGDREEILSHGFDEYLSKPVEKEQILDVIERMLHGH